MKKIHNIERKVKSMTSNRGISHRLPRKLSEFTGIIFLIMISLMATSQSACSCSTAETVYAVSSGSSETSCDGSCDPECYKMQTMIYEYPAGVNITIYKCFQCDCTSGKNVYKQYEPIPVPDIWWYSCNGICAEPSFTCKQYQLASISIVSTGLQGIYRCRACPLNCLTCSSPTVCIACDSANNYFLRPNGTCQTCRQIFGTDCTSCDSTQCFTCQAPKVLDYGSGNQSCVSCSSIPNCNICRNGPLCTSCFPSFVVDYSLPDDGCGFCGGNCAACSNGPLCTTCNVNTYLNFSDGRKSCGVCNQFCSTCVDGPQCKVCQSNYFLEFTTSNQSCVPCSVISNCANCINGPKCTACTFPFVLDFASLNKSCLPCSSMPNCKTCDNGPICLTCQSDHVLDFTSLNTTCFSCSAMPNCQICSNGPICDICIPGFYLVFSTLNTSCTSCNFANCASCAHGPVCSRCITNHIIDPTFTVCTSCPHRQYEKYNNCHPCASKCTSCQVTGSSVICNSCDTNFVLHFDILSCVDCKSVTPKCVACSDMLTCTLCEYPFIVGSSGKCDSCQNGFDYLEGLCTKPSGCVSFLPGYTKCLACASNHHFVYSQVQNLCVCQNGYKLTDTGKAKVCQAQCGDGIESFPDEDCDDGNSRDNDGCDQKCKREGGFTCVPSSPSQCYLDYKIGSFAYNYAYKYEGENRGQFSFSLSPKHSSFTYMDWAKYLSLNISSSFIISNTVSHTYASETNEIIVEFDYSETLEDLTVKATLSFLSPQSVQSSADQPGSSQLLKVSASRTTVPKIIANLSELFLTTKLEGNNAALIVQSQGTLVAAKGASTISLTVTVILMIQFFLGTFFHKMIGLETVQVLQFAFFSRMMLNLENVFIINALNPLKYSVYGGYTNYQLFFGSNTKQIQYYSNTVVSEEFLSVSMMKYFLLNVNLTLILPAVSLLIYGILLMDKSRKRNHFMRSNLQSDKDQYTQAKRRSQRVYDNAVFPFINVLSMASLFCVILDLESQSASEGSDLMLTIEKASFFAHLAVLFVGFIIFTHEALTSYEDYKDSLLTEEERSRIPQTTIQKLEHDKNYPYRSNYKPGYILIYLAYFFVLELIIMFDILIEEFHQFGLDILVGVSFAYLVLIWRWQPYCSDTHFHNKVLRFNHFVMFLFTVVCEVLNRFTLSQVGVTCVVYFCIFCMMMVSIMGYARIYVENKFREKLCQDPSVGLGFDSDEVTPKEKRNNQMIRVQKVERLKKLLINNQFTYKNQMKYNQIQRQQTNPLRKGIVIQKSLNQIKDKMRKELSNSSALADYLQNPTEMFKKEKDKEINNFGNEGSMSISQKLMLKMKQKKEKGSSGKGKRKEMRMNGVV